METSKFKKYLDALGKEGNSSNILKLLTKIRGSVEWPKHSNNINVLRDRGSLQQLVYFLHTQQRKHILDVCLSILGNCVMEKNCARAMTRIPNTLSALNHVLKCYPNEDSLNGRVFRVLGNLLSKDKLGWADLIISRKPQIITHLLELLGSRASENAELTERYSEATILMALRILKYLPNKQDHLETFPILNTIGSLFIKYSQEWQERQTNETNLNALIALLYQLSVNKDYSMVTQLKSTNNGNALKELVNVLLLCPRKIIEIIMNFITVSKLNSDLPILPICNKFIQAVVKNLNDEDLKPECLEYIKCLCHLLDHPANRTSQQCGKTISVLIEALKKLKQPTDLELQCCVLLVNTLSKCQYAEYLVQEQLRCNILDVVVTKLEWIVDTHITHTHSFNVESKRKCDFDESELYPEGSFCVKRKLCGCCLERLDLINNDCPMTHGTRAVQRVSPCESDISDYDENDDDEDNDGDEDSCHSSVSNDKKLTIVTNDRSLSPCSSSGSDYVGVFWASPCSSPRSINSVIEISDSDDYSPVCSDEEGSENLLKTKETKQSGKTDAIAEYIYDVEDKEDGQKETLPEHSTKRLKVSLIYELTRLVRSFIKLHPPIPQLGSEKLLIALLNCSDFFDTKKATYLATANLVCDILHSPIYLQPLLETEFIEKVYDLTRIVHSQFCVTCLNQSEAGKMVMKRLVELAGTETGKHYVVSMLRSRKIEAKKQTVLVLPYIIEDKKTLADMLLTHGGLNVLTRLLKEDFSRKSAIKCLCELALNKLKIVNPKSVVIDVAKTLATFSAEPPDYQASVKLVTFILDDGRQVKGDRNLLMEKSEYFTNLLSGSFKESSEDEVCLQDVKFETLNCLLNLVGSVNENKEIALDTLLDVIVLSDRYLMSDICSLVTNYVEKYRMSTGNVAQIYNWSLESRLDFLRVESLAYFLVNDASDSVRLETVNAVFRIGNRDDFISDIYKMLERYLSPFTCR